MYTGLLLQKKQEVSDFIDNRRYMTSQFKEKE